MTNKELEAAIESARRTLAKLGETAAQTGISIEEAARCLRNLVNPINPITFADTKPINANVITKTKIYEELAQEKKEIIEPMIDKEYTSVYSDVEFDFDTKSEFKNMMQEEAKVQVKDSSSEFNIATNRPLPPTSGSNAIKPSRLDCRILLRNDTTSNWNESNPVLSKGEIAIEYSNDGSSCYVKCGDGVRAFKDLPYITSPLAVNDEVVYAIGGRGNSIKIEF